MSKSKPVIGITTDYRTPRKDAIGLHYVASGYTEAVLAGGGIPMLLPQYEERADMERILYLLDGLVFIGGNDLDPRRDGYMLHPATRLMDPRREAFERELMNMAAERRIPVFGIGSGMQLLNVSQGGNLFLHLPEDLPKALPHRDPQDQAHRHSLEVVPGTLIGQIYGEGEVRVNSMHHMAVDEVAPGFVVSARCPDGVIEAIESVMPDWFAIGTQFHPEADSASRVDVRIFEEFVEAIRNPKRSQVKMAA